MIYQSLQAILVASLILLLTACANNYVAVKTSKIEPSSNYVAVKNSKIESSSSIKQVLYDQFSEWKAVKYRFGGLSQNGIDCSGFVYLTFLKKFTVQLPRTTHQQVKSGVKVGSQANLKAGDLVFFKTGIRQKHVGIYLEKRTFLHVSSKKGVIISRLDNPYWKKRYWRAIRVLNP